MAIHIVDNQKLDMTDEEWTLYQKIVTSYNKPPYQNGSDLFIGLFQSNDNGIITLIKPPSQRHTTMEAFLFVVALHQQQHVREMYSVVEDMCAQIKAKITEIDDKMKGK